MERALDVIRSEPLADAIGMFVSASLETEADLIRELREERWGNKPYSSAALSEVERG